MLRLYLTENINAKIVSYTYKHNNYNLNTYLAVRFGALSVCIEENFKRMNRFSDTNCNDPTTLDLWTINENYTY